MSNRLISLQWRIPSELNVEHWLMRTSRTTESALSRAAMKRPRACCVDIPTGCMSTSTLILYVVTGASRSINGWEPITSSAFDIRVLREEGKGKSLAIPTFRDIPRMADRRMAGSALWTRIKLRGTGPK